MSKFFATIKFHKVFFRLEFSLRYLSAVWLNWSLLIQKPSKYQPIEEYEKQSE